MATLEQFMTAISGQESGGDYDITNPNSGAHGRFQIMPENWPKWAAEAGLGADAPKTARNQDIVAAFKMQQYYNQYGNWADVASIWYSGRPLSALSDEQRYGKNYTEGVEYPSIQEYTDSIMGRLGEGGGSTRTMAEQLPYTQQEYQQKLARFLFLEKQYSSADPILNPMNPADLQEMANLEAELTEYERIRDAGGQDVSGDIARANYNNSNSNAAIDAENSANAWARQQKINEQALSKTTNDMGEQRLTADSANAETAKYRESSHFSAPMGFRVGATNLPTEEELFSRNIAKAAKDLPEVKPIPYSQQLPSTALGPRTASAASAATAEPDAYHKSLTLDTWPNTQAESDTLKPAWTPPKSSDLPTLFPGRQSSPAPAPVAAALGPREQPKLTSALELRQRLWNPSILRGRR